jgi:hypothetical protein
MNKFWKKSSCMPLFHNPTLLLCQKTLLAYFLNIKKYLKLLDINKHEDCTVNRSHIQFVSEQLDFKKW